MKSDDIFRNVFCEVFETPLKVESDDIFRNVFCPYYNDCLNNAVRKNILSWDCSTCQFRDETEPFDYSEAERCQKLIDRIFSKNPTKREYIRGMNKGIIPEWFSKHFKD